MNEISRQTRQASYIQKPGKRCMEILEAMDDESMTARQIANKLGYLEMNAVRPRLTELEDLGLVEVVGKAFDFTTRRSTGIYRRTGEQLKLKGIG